MALKREKINENDLFGEFFDEFFLDAGGDEAGDIAAQCGDFADDL